MLAGRTGAISIVVVERFVHCVSRNQICSFRHQRGGTPCQGRLQSCAGREDGLPGSCSCSPGSHSTRTLPTEYHLLLSCLFRHGPEFSRIKYLFRLRTRIPFREPSERRLRPRSSVCGKRAGTRPGHLHFWPGVERTRLVPCRLIRWKRSGPHFETDPRLGRKPSVKRWMRCRFCLVLLTRPGTIWSPMGRASRPPIRKSVTPFWRKTFFPFRHSGKKAKSVRGTRPRSIHRTQSMMMATHRRPSFASSSFSRASTQSTLRRWSLLEEGEDASQFPRSYTSRCISSATAHCSAF